MDAHSSQPVIRLQDLRFGWNGGGFGLAVDDLAIAPGEHCLLTGPSGSGKTTLLGLLGGVLKPQSGSVTVLGQRLDTMRATGCDAFRAAHIGVVFQLFNLVPYLPVLENVLLPCRFSAERRARAIAGGQNPRASARSLLDRLGLGPALLSRPVTALSVGQQQRVAVARALLGAPEIVLADEPTSALDAETSQEFMTLLFEESSASGSTIIFVSHDQSLASYFRRRIDVRAFMQDREASATMPAAAKGR